MEYKINAITSFLCYSDLSIEVIADQLDMDVRDVQKIIDRLMKADILISSNTVSLNQ
jgi:hypothetical protein